MNCMREKCLTQPKSDLIDTADLTETIWNSVTLGASNTLLGIQMPTKNRKLFLRGLQRSSLPLGIGEGV